MFSEPVLFYQERSEFASVILDNKEFYCKLKHRSSDWSRCFIPDVLLLYL